MTIHTILRMGDPVLLQKASLVTFDNPAALTQLIADMRETMIAADGAGLAAPQIGISQQLVIYELNDNPRYPDVEAIPFTVLINPVITPLVNQQQAGWEGCLSLPGLRGEVARYTRIRVDYQDVHGQSQSMEVEGFHARVVQHEVDHLLGILYPMRMKDMSRFGFRDELEQHGVTT